MTVLATNLSGIGAAVVPDYPPLWSWNRQNRSLSGHGSGEIMIGFTTANRVDTKSTCEVEVCARIKEEKMNEACEAAAEAVEEAILNSMVTAKEKRGLDGADTAALQNFWKYRDF